MTTAAHLVTKSGSEEVAKASVGALAKAVHDGMGGPVLAGILAGVVSSAALWGLHEVVGGREDAQRTDALEDRIETLEQRSLWNQWALTSIARAVEAELPPTPPPPPKRSAP